MIYYGLSFNTSDLPGNVYVTYTLSALSELPGFLICVPMMEKFGRKPSIVSLLGVGGVSCIIAGFVHICKYSAQVNRDANDVTFLSLDQNNVGDGGKDVRSGSFRRRLQLLRRALSHRRPQYRHWFGFVQRPYRRSFGPPGARMGRFMAFFSISLLVHASNLFRRIILETGFRSSSMDVSP